MTRTLRTLPILLLLASAAFGQEALVGILPVAGSTPGAQGATFRTGLQLTNPGTGRVEGRLVFRAQGTSPSPSDPSLQFALGARQTVAFEDVVAEMGGEGLGSIEVLVSEGAAPVVVARAYAAGEGTRGVGVPLIAPHDAVGAGRSATLIIPADLERFRFNVGVRTLGEGARVHLTLFAPDGTLVADLGEKSWPANRFEQKPGAEFAGHDLVANGTLVAAVLEGSLILYGTTTDNLTNDPSLQIDELFNKAPVVVELAVISNPDGTFTIRVRVEDPDGDPVDLVIESGPSNGTAGPVQDLGDGVFEIDYTPGGEEPDSLGLGLSDGQGNTTEVTVELPGGGVNDAPVANDQAVATDEDVPVTITLSGSDPDADALTFSIVSGPSNGTVGAVSSTSGTAATVTYTPEANFEGTDSFTFEVNDNRGATDQAVVTITVIPVNDEPFATVDAYTVLEDQVLTVGAPGLLANDFDPDGTALTAQLVAGPANGSLTLNADGSFTYTPSANFFGADGFTYRATDGIAFSVPATVSLTVTAVNDAPSFTAGVDQTVSEDSGAASVTGWATAISAGPAETQTLTFGLTNDDNALFSVQPAIAADGTLTFTPAPNMNGVATVSVTLQDDGGTANGGVDTSAPPATFTITVTAINDAPSFTKGADQSVLEDSGAASVAGWATGMSPGPADEAGQTLTFNATNDNNALFSAQPAIDATTGALTFTPAADASGIATVSVTLQDSGSGLAPNVNTSAGQTFTITVTAVNDAPSFTAGADQSVLEDSGAATVGAWATAVSPGPVNEAGQALSFEVTNDNNGLFVVQPSIAADGTLTYTPATDANGTATITVVLKDDGGTANGGVDTSASPATFTITVTAVNDAPGFTAGPDVTVLEDGGAYGPAAQAGSISAGPADEAAQALTFLVSNDNNALFLVQPALDASGNLTFTPAANGFGVATVTVTLSDDGGTANGGADASAAQQFTVTVTAVNDAPSFTAGGDVTTALEDTAYSAAWASGMNAGPTEMQALSFNVTGNTNPGLFASGPSIDGTTGVLSFTPAANANGAATITVALQDDGGTANGGADTSAPATFTITVGAVNDAPAFTAGADVTVLEDGGAYGPTPQAGSISAGPVDEAGQTLTFLLSNDNNGLFSVQPALDASGNLTFTPAPNAFGAATVTVQLQDDGGTANGGADTAAAQQITITVTAVNDAPGFIAGADVTTALEDIPYSAAWASGFDAGPGDGGQTLTFNVTGNSNPGLFASGPSIDGTTGVLSFTPAANANGAATITVALQDDGGTANGGADTSAPATFTITVGAVNDAPAFTAGADQTVLEDAGEQAVTPWASGISAGPADEAGQTLTFLVSNDNNALFLVQPALDASGNLTFRPAADAFGAATVSVTLTDDGGTANGGADASTPQQFTITVTAVNDAPGFTSGGNVTSPEDVVYAVAWANAVSAGPGETDGLTFTITNNTNAALFSTGPSLAADGILSFTPTANQSGTATITVVLVDDGGTANGGTDTSAPPVAFDITITAVNDAPVADAQAVATDEDTPLLITLSASDVDGDALTFNVPGVTSLGTLGAPSAPSCSVAGGVSTCTATVTYSPGTDANGPDSFTFTADDGTTPSAPATVSITVDAVNDGPVNTAPLLTQTVQEGTPFVFSMGTGNPIAFTDIDLGGNPAQVTLQSSAGHGTITLSGVAGLTFSLGDGTDDEAMAFTGTQAAINTALDGMTYSSTLGYEGPATLTIVTNDQGFTGTPGPLMDTDVVTLDVVRPNDPPVNTVPAAQAMVEDATLTFSAVNTNAISIADPDAGTANVEVSLSVANGTLTLGSIPVTLGFTTGDGTADAAMVFQGPLADISTALEGLVYAPDPDYFGADTLTVDTDDLGNTGTGGAQTDLDTVTITITGINDAPAFTSGGDVAVNEDSGAYSAAWATGVSAGPANEAAQTLTWTVGNSNNALFSSQPALDLSGNLTFTPAANASGSATVTVSLMDNGGTAGGGVDTTGPVMFTVTVNPVNDPPAGGADGWETFGNTTLLVGAPAIATPHVIDQVAPNGGVLDNDSDPVEADPVSVTGIKIGGTPCADGTAPFSCATALGGTVVMEATGAFSYTPPRGAGSPSVDSFTYVLTDQPAVGTAASVDVTVTFTLREVVWYVDGSVAGPGTGVSTDPFKGLASIAAGDGSDDDDVFSYIFLHDSTVTGSIELELGQSLWGEGYGLRPNRAMNGTPAPYTVVPAGTKPLLTSSTGHTVVVEANTAKPNRTQIDIRGLSVATTAPASSAIKASSANAAAFGVTISDVAVTASTADGIDIDHGSSASTNLSLFGLAFSNAATSSGHALSVARTGGTLTFPTFFGITVDGTCGAGVSLDGVTFNNTPNGTVSIGSLADPVSRDGFRAVNFTGSAFLSGLTIHVDGGPGLRLDGANSATSFVQTPLAATAVVRATGGPAVDVSDLQGTLVFNQVTSINSPTTGVSIVNFVDGTLGASFAAIAGTIENAAGDAFYVQGGNATISWPGTITNSIGRSVVVQNRLADSATFTGTITDIGTGILLSSNIGSTTTFTGAVNLSTGVNPAFTATGGGTLDVVDSGAATNSITTTTGTALTIQGVTVGGSGVTFDSVGTSGAATGIVLDSIGANPVSINGGSIQNATSRGIDINGGNGNITYAGSITTNNAAAIPLEVTNHTGGTVTVSGAISNTGTSSGINLAGNSGATITLSGGLNLDTAGNTGLTFTGGGTLNISGGANTIDTTTGTGVVLNGVTLNTSGGGLDVTKTGAGTAFSVTGGTVAIATGTGTGLDINSGTASGFVATSGGTVTLTGSNNTITSTTGTAVNVANTTIGGSNLEFRSISAGTAVSGPATAGIILDTTGSSGGLKVSGTGSAGSGGTIQSCVQRGARILNSSNLSLTSMNFTNNGTANLDSAGICGDNLNGTNTNCAAGLDLQTVSGVSLTGVHVSGGVQQGINGKNVTGLTMTDVEVNGVGNEANESGIQIHNLFGTLTWGAVNSHDNASRQLNVQNSTSTALSLTINNSTFSNTTWPGSTTSAQGILFSGTNNAQMTISVQNSTIARNFGPAFQSDSATGADINSTVNGGSLIDNGQHFVIASTGNGNMTYALTNVTTMWVDPAHSGVTPISIARGSGASGTFSGVIRGNTIGLAGTANSGACNGGCNVISVRNNGSTGGVNQITIGGLGAGEGNTIRRSGGGGINVTAGFNTFADNGTMRVQIFNNTLTAPDGTGTGLPITVVNGTTAGDTSQTCADIQGNNISAGGGSGSWNLSAAIRLRHPVNNSAYLLPGYTGGATDLSAVDAYLNNRNTLNGGTAAAQLTGGGTYANTPGGSPCF